MNQPSSSCEPLVCFVCSVPCDEAETEAARDHRLTTEMQSLTCGCLNKNYIHRDCFHQWYDVHRTCPHCLSDGPKSDVAVIIGNYQQGSSSPSSSSPSSSPSSRGGGGGGVAGSPHVEEDSSTFTQCMWLCVVMVAGCLLCLFAGLVLIYARGGHDDDESHDDMMMYTSSHDH